MATAQAPPTLEQLLKAAPLTCRASIDVPAPVLRANGADLTPELRDQLLAKCAAGEYVELDVDMLAYEQQAGVANRNFVRFRDGGLMALGRSGIGKPFLRDHASYDSQARAGTITASQTDKRGEGDYGMRMTARLTAPWAVELALRNLLSGVSIGWAPTGPVECSVHQAPVGTECWCYPGARLAETVDAKGNKKYTSDRTGQIRAEWVYTDAQITECSVCNVPAVPGAGIDGVRAALSAAGIDVDALELLRASNSTTAIAPPIVNPTKELEMTTPTIIVLTEAQAAYSAKLSPTERDAFNAKSSAERDAAVAAALALDPVIFESGTLKVRKSDGEVALAIAKQHDAQAKQLAAQAAQLTLATEAATTATLRARVSTEISHLGGALDVKVAVLRALDGIADEPTRAAALAMLRGADVLAVEASKAKGVNPGSDPKPDSPEAKAEALAFKIASEQKCSLEKARALVWETAEGLALYAEIENRKTAARNGGFASA